MADKRGYVDVEFDGELRTLRFDFNKIAQLEGILGFPVTAIANNLGVNTVINAFFVGLREEYPKLTPQKVGKILQKDGRFVYYAQKVTEALMSALGVDEEEDDDEGN